MERYCRICMRNDLDQDEMVSLFCERKGEVVANMIIDCADVMVSHDDNLPDYVCPDCLERLVDAFTLRKLIRESEGALQSLAIQMKAENAGEIPEDPLQMERVQIISEQSIAKGSAASVGKSTTYPTTDQIESVETFETYKVIRLRGVRCCGCQEILSSKNDLVEHSHQEHSHRAASNSRDQAVFQCPTCFERFQNRMKLLNHTKNYESNEIYHCTVCDILFDIKYRLLQHQNLSKAHQVVAVDGTFTDHPDEGSSKIVPKEKKRNQSRKRVGKELTYPDAEFILCIDETQEYQVIHLGGERCCGCDMMFHSYQDLIDHCSEIHPRKDGEDATYECILCFEKFDQVQSYNRHRSARVQREIYYCKFCDVVIDIKFRFDQHLKTSVAHQAAVEKAGITSIFPKEEKPVNELRTLENHIEVLEIDGIRCCGCEFVCNSRQELEDHSEERHGFEKDKSNNSKDFECDICFKCFSNLGLFTCHRNLALQRTVYRCKYCDMQSEIKYRILQHVAGSAHQIEDQKEPISEAEPKIYNCCFVKCAITFEDPNDLLDHVEEHHASKRRENAQERESNAFICYVCHKSFKNERSLQSHQFPKKTETQNVCSTCGASFLYLSALINHEKMHTGIKEYQCDICDKAFFDERALRVHKVCHNEERPYVCDVCSKSFLRKGNLRVHKRCHSESIWDCPHCSGKYKTKQSLTLHIRSHTGEKPFECRYCTNRYSHSTDRNRHEMAAHTKVRPHKCPHCDMTFIRKRQLTLHERIHTGERPYTCHICDRTFVQSTYLKKHLATHEKHGTHIKETEYMIKVLPEESETNYEVVEMLEDEADFEDEQNYDEEDNM
ncbi:zinc finger protein 84-like [Ochlerotatus camptorhynchus]|uniref:zinc finger protein 84-like n=1 Tax=Ochlerotatus camptorhynchus TaxID=644619 RepID=UPI0031E213E5